VANAQLKEAFLKDLQAMPKERLVALVAQMQGALEIYQQTIVEIVDERDAARLLNELCHYDSPVLLEGSLESPLRAEGERDER
jgi:hypothetical protein